jgi:hypothetical protein
MTTFLQLPFELPFDAQQLSPFMVSLLDAACMEQIERRVQALAGASMMRKMWYLASQPSTALAGVVLPSDNATTEEMLLSLRQFYVEWITHYCSLNEILRHVEVMFEHRLQSRSEMVQSLADRILHDERQYKNDILSLWGVLHEYPALMPFVLEGDVPPVGVGGAVFFRSAWLWFRRRQRYKALFTFSPQSVHMAQTVVKGMLLYSSDWDLAAVRVGEVFPTSAIEQKPCTNKEESSAISELSSGLSSELRSELGRLFWERLLSVESQGLNAASSERLVPPFTKYWDWRWETHPLPRRVLLLAAERVFAERDAVHRAGLVLCCRFRQLLLTSQAHLIAENVRQRT